MMVDAETINSPDLLWEQTGLEVTDIRDNPEYAARRVHLHDIGVQMDGMRRIAQAFVERTETIHQELIDIAIELCRADSAGISIERPDQPDENFYHWIATAGQYSGFLDAVLPRFPSACSICLERGRPQLFRVGKRFFDLLGVEAPVVKDGILLPWEVNEIRGTIFIMSHEKTEAFDLSDCRIMEVLADFAAMGIKQQAQQRFLMEQTSAAAASTMANELAHKINNPLQSLTNLLYLAAEGGGEQDVRTLARQASGDLSRLSSLVQKLLALPYSKGSSR
jgi:signal transduction histidine kinase